jgi:hypothetical protein
VKRLSNEAQTNRESGIANRARLIGEETLKRKCRLRGAGHLNSARRSTAGSVIFASHSVHGDDAWGGGCVARGSAGTYQTQARFILAGIVSITSPAISPNVIFRRRIVSG